MRHFYKSHGKHCYLRSFRTVCPTCNTDVLYWECAHGCKVFFEYPPYGKLVRHFCRRHLSSSHKKNRYRIIVKKPIGLLEKEYLSCPICGKLFKTEIILIDHFNQMKKNDLEHKLFSEDNFLFERKVDEKKNTKVEKVKIVDSPKFGEINIKRVKKDN